MNKSLLAFFLFVSVFTYAETECDVILTNNNFQIPCTIINIDDTEVKYKDCPSVFSKLVYISISDIRKIYLSDGTILDYTQGIPPIVPKFPISTTNPDSVKNVLMQMSFSEEKVKVAEFSQQEEKKTPQNERVLVEGSVSEGKGAIALDESSVKPSDIILTTNAQKIEAKITEVSKSEIRYKEKDNLGGPTFVIETTDIHSILYANGKVVLYNQQNTSSANNEHGTSTSITNVNRRLKYARKDIDTSCPCTNVKIELGEVYNDWKKYLDYINVIERINIQRYRSIYIYPIDITQIQLPEQSDDQYSTIAEAIESFPYTIREKITSKYSHLNVIVVDADEEVQLPKASIGICLRFEEFELMRQDNGVQKITLSGVVIDNTNKHLFDFKQRRLTIKNRPLLVNLQKEFKHFAEDICRIFGDLL